MIQKYRKKPVEVEAIQHFGKYSHDQITEWAGYSVIGEMNEDEEFIIHTLEGDMIAKIGDYIIKGVNGEFYPCKPDIFEKTYEKVD